MHFRTFAALLLTASTSRAQVAGRDVQRDDAQVIRKPISLPRSYAVIIGTNQFKNLDPKYNLRFAERDAEAISNVLISQDGGNLDFQNVRKLLGHDATIANIRDIIEKWLPQNLKESDQLIFFFVGHGISAGQQTYLAAYDTDLANLGKTAYSLNRLGEIMASEVRASRKVVLVDACHSGDISPPAVIQESLSSLPEDFLVLTSSRSKELSYEDKELAGGRGVFSYFLEQGWKGQADVEPKDGFVLAGELIHYVQREVSLYAKKQQKDQNPTERGRYENNMVLGFSPTRRMQLAESTPELAFGSLIIQVPRTEVRILMDGKDVGEASPGKELQLPGISPGIHLIQGVRKGFDPVEVSVNVVPGLVKLVELPMKYSRRIKAESESLQKQGREAWEKARSGQDVRRAVELFEKSLRADERNSDAALGLSRAFQALGESKKAFEASRRTIKIDPDFAEAHMQLGILQLEGGDPSDAVRSLQTAARIEPKNALVKSNLAMAYFDVDKYEEAEKEATAAIELAGTGTSAAGQALTNRAEARRSLGRYDEAIPDYLAAIKAQTFDSGFLGYVRYWGLSFAPGMGKRTRSGVRNLYKEQKATIYSGLCAAELGLERYAKALEYCRQSSRIDKEDDSTYSLMAEVYRRMFIGDQKADYLDAAIVASERALILNPEADNAGKIKLSLSEMKSIREQIRTRAQAR